MSEQQVTTPSGDLAVETLRTLIVAGLDELEGLLPLVTRLYSTHQKGIGFLTVEARAVMDDTIRKEREARHWNYVHSGVKITGDVPAPGNISAYAIVAEVSMVLTGIVSDLTRRLRRAGLCLIAGAPYEATPEQLMASTRLLVGMLTNVDTLDHVDRETARLVAMAKKLVDGDDKKKHPEPCPHCGRMTLVIYISQGVIRCEKDAETEKLERCLCNDSNSPYCPCRRNRTYRHEWFRKPPTARERDWWDLKNAQTLAERRETEKHTEGAPA